MSKKTKKIVILSEVELRNTISRLTSEIINANVYSVVERTNLEKILKEQKFQHSGLVAQAQAGWQYSGRYEAHRDHRHAEPHQHQKKPAQRERIAGVEQSHPGSQQPAQQHESAFHDHARAIALWRCGTSLIST